MAQAAPLQPTMTHSLRTSLLSKVLTVLAVLGPTPRAAAEGAQAESWRLRTDYARATLPGGERLDLAGVALLLEGPSGLYLGPSLQGALRGERGGFFAGGLEGGARTPLTGHLLLDGGLFLGGGGGGGAPVGGGFMLRPRLGLQWDGAPLRVGLGLSRLVFPSGGIRSTQAYLTVEGSFSTPRLTEGGGPWRGEQGWHLQRDFLELKGIRYTASGRLPAFDLAGFTWGHALQGPLFLQVEASAAARGAASGYMEVLGGLGGLWYLDGGHRFALRGALEAGSGGGGYTGTGGGFLVKGTAGFQVQVTRAVHLLTEAGRVAAPSTSFRETLVVLGAGFSLDTLAPGPGPRVPEDLSALRWRLSSGFQYLGSVARRSGVPAGSVEQYVFKAEALLSDRLYLTGQSGWGVGGHAGAWATGLLGLGAQTADHGGHRLRVELAGGAGGGGGVDSPGGALVQALAGWNWDCSRSWSVHLMGGTVRGLHGGLASPVLELGAGFRGIRPVSFLTGR